MIDLPDGVYDVTNERFSAGFAVSRGNLVWCAPILRRRLIDGRYLPKAKWVGPLPPALEPAPAPARPREAEQSNDEAPERNEPTTRAAASIKKTPATKRLPKSTR